MKLWPKFTVLFRKRKLDADMAEEMRLHLERRTEENVADGMSRADARYAALRKFGGMEQAKEMAREQRTLAWAEYLARDVGFAARSLRKNSGFTAVAVLTLALGIGVNTAMFSVVYGVLLDPYPYAKPDEIWVPQITGAKSGGNANYARLGDYLEMAKMPAVASAMATETDFVTLSGGINPEFVGAMRLTGTAFEFLGVPPLIGRGLTPADLRPNGEPEPVTVLSFKLWQRLFGGDPAALGRTVILGDQPHTVVGVMPPRFGWYMDDGLWLPLGLTDARRVVRPLFRFKDGISKEVAGQQLNVLCQELAKVAPDRFPRDGFMASFINYLDLSPSNGEMRSSLQLLFFAVAFLLLIACSNVANLQLARGAARSREIAIRLALGAGRSRVVRQLLTESVGLALMGGLIGVFFAWGLTHVIIALMPNFYVPNEARVTLNGGVLLFSVGVSMLTGILFGLVPSLQCSRPHLNDALKEGGCAAGTGERASRTRNTLVIVEVALSVVLLVGASLAIRGFAELQRIDRGFDTERTMFLQIPLDPKRYATMEQRTRFSHELVERVRRLPGVAAATIGDLPAFEAALRSSGLIPGQPKIETGLSLNLIDADYLATLGLPLRSGRNFTATEIEHGDHVALISEAAAKLWPVGENPIGRTIHSDALVGGTAYNLGPDGATKELTVVGIVGDSHGRNLRLAPPPVIFVPYTLRGPALRFFMVRTQGDPNALINPIRAEVRAIDQEQPFVSPSTLDEIMDKQAIQPRFNLALFGSLALVALALAAAGIYSVLSYRVAQRTREIGVRIALGAASGDILRLILVSGSRLLAAGLFVGAATSLTLAKILKSQVFAVPLLDPLAVAAAVFVLSAVAMLACYLPARRATKVDPVVALRAE